MSAQGADRKWQLEITALVASVKTNQENLHEKLDVYIVDTNKRLEKLDKIVIGNGHKGLSEEVRSIKGKWGAVYTATLILLNGVVAWGLHRLIK